MFDWPKDGGLIDSNVIPTSVGLFYVKIVHIYIYLVVSLELLYIVVWFQIFLSNTNNLHTDVWFQVFQLNTNNLHTDLWFQVFQSNTNNLHTYVWFQVSLSNTNNLYTVVWFLILKLINYTRLVVRVFNARSTHAKDTKKWYLIRFCLTLNIIRYVSRVKWSNPRKGVAPSTSPRCRS